MSGYAREMAEYKNALTIILMDIQREKVMDIPGLDEAEMPLDRRVHNK